MADPPLCKGCEARPPVKDQALCRACAHKNAAAEAEAVLVQIGASGLTERARSLSQRVGFSTGRRLQALKRQGKVAHCGGRWFPTSWLPAPLKRDEGLTPC